MKQPVLLLLFKNCYHLKIYNMFFYVFLSIFGYLLLLYTLLRISYV